MHHLRKPATPLPPLALPFREGWPWLRPWPRSGAEASAGEVVRVVVYDKAWNVAYRRDRDAGRRRYVDAAPVRARLRSLLDAGVPLRTLGRVTGLSATTVSYDRGRHPGACAARHRRPGAAPDPDLALRERVQRACPAGRRRPARPGFACAGLAAPRAGCCRDHQLRADHRRPR